MGTDEFFNKLIFLPGSRMNGAGCIKLGPWACHLYALRSHQKHARNTCYLPRCYWVRPPAIVSLLFSGLDHFCLPAMRTKQRLRIIGASTPPLHGGQRLLAKATS